jgi:GH25 family lysozyme M1 (1,4-beta-N-acetylmuramidase)
MEGQDMAVGVDLHCYYQRGVNWTQVSGVNYVWVKVSDGGAAYTKTVGGVTYRPDTLVQGAKSRGIPVGGYHFAQPGDPRAQADLLIREVERLGATGVLPALDIEDPFPIGQARAFGEAFCNRIRERGYRPVVYTGDSYAATIRPADWASQPVLWIARYGAKPKNTRFDVHQYSSSGSLPGSASAVDFNESYNNSHLMQGSDDVALGGDDFKYLFYNNPIQEFGNLSQLLAEIKDKTRLSAALSASIQNLTTLVTQNEANDITKADLDQALQGVVTTEIGPIVRQELVAALGEQQSQQADDVANSILTKLVDRLTSATGPAAPAEGTA